MERGQETGERHQKVIVPLIPLLVTFSVVIVTILKTPELTTLIVSELSKFIQSPAVQFRLEAILTFRVHAQASLENFSQKLLTSGEWSSLEIDSNSLTLGSRVRYVLVAGVVDISVIIPTLNEEKYLPSCLHSLSNQDFEGDFEIIVADGGSVDRTLDIAEDMADHVILVQGRPVGAARNEGARIAEGRTVAFIDADTWASTGWLTAVKSALQDTETIGVTGPTLPYQARTMDTITYTFWTIYLQRLLLSAGMPHVIGFNCAYRKRQFLLAGGFDETSVTSEDIQLARRMRKHGRIVFDKKMSALTSPRRFRSYSHAYIAGLYVLNGFSTLLLNRSYQKYPPVR